MSTFNNLSIRSKIFVVPAGMILFIMMLGVYGFMLLSSNAHKLDHLNNGILAQSAKASSLRREASTSVLSLYRTISTATNENDPEKLKKMVEEQTQKLNDLKTQVTETKKSLAEAGMEDGIIQNLDDAFQSYTQSAALVLDTVRTDKAGAVNIMMGIEHKFDTAYKMTMEINKKMDEMKRDEIAGMQAAMARGRLIFGISIVVVVSVALLLSFLIGNKTAGPIIALAEAVKRIAASDYHFEIPAQEQTNEIGTMARSISNFRQSLIANQEMERQQKEETQQKLARQIQVDRLVQEFDTIASGAVNSVAAAAGELSKTAIEMSNTAARTSTQTATVATASQDTASNVQSVAAAAEEMAASVSEISSQVAKSVSIAREASAEAKAASVNSAEMLDAARSISAVTQMIEGIAGQINLLALNATIESARAGEAGKGFAVVASEVKNLAMQTAKATEDIRHQLAGVQQMAENMADALVKLDKSVARVDEVSSGIAAAVEEQTAVTQEITKNMNTAASSVGEINNNIGGIQASTESTSVATQEILSAAELLSRQAEHLSAEVSQFLTSIRVA